MHDNIRTEAPGWEPHIGMDGRVEVTAHFYDDSVERMCFGGVSLSKYIELWKGKKLHFQVKKATRPAHLPTLEQAHEELKREQEKQEPDYYTDAELPPARANGLSDLRYGFRMQQKVQAPKPQKIRIVPKLRFKIAPKPKPAPKPQIKKEPPPPPPPPVWDPEVCARGFLRLSVREQEILRLAPEWKVPAGMPEKNAQIYFSTACTRIGMPINGKSFNRREELKKVLEEVEKLQRPVQHPIVVPEARSKPAKDEEPARRTRSGLRVHARLMDDETSQQIRFEYKKAAKVIRQRGEAPTANALSKELSLPEVFVKSYLYEHPNFEKD